MSFLIPEVLNVFYLFRIINPLNTIDVISNLKFATLFGACVQWSSCYDIGLMWLNICYCELMMLPKVFSFGTDDLGPLCVEAIVALLVLNILNGRYKLGF